MEARSKPLPVFDRKTCMACKMCVDVCPVSCIGVEESGRDGDPHGYPFLADPEACTRCGWCADDCPVAAVHLPAA